MAESGTARFVVTYMPISVIVKRKSDKMLLHFVNHSFDLPKDLQ